MSLTKLIHHSRTPAGQAGVNAHHDAGLVATTHRVITEEERYSSGWFHGADLRTRLDPLPLAPRVAAAVARSPRHAHAGFMATPDELGAGRGGISSTGAGIFGQQLWNYYLRSHPDNARHHHPDVVPAR